MTDERVDYAAEPGEFVRDKGLERATYADIVNHEAGKYSRRRAPRPGE